MILRNPCGRSISSREWEAVTHVVFQTRGDLLLRGDVRTFEAAHESNAHHFREIRIFTKRFPETGPAGIASEIEYRREAPRNSRGASFDRGDLGRAPHQFRVPRCRHADLLGKESRTLDVVRAMYRVDGVDHRNAEPGFLCSFLNLVDDLVPAVDRQCLIRDVKD